MDLRDYHDVKAAGGCTMILDGTNVATGSRGHYCGRPVTNPAGQRTERNYCPECLAAYNQMPRAGSPMVADVFREMQTGLSQDEAVRKLGGQP